MYHLQILQYDCSQTIAYCIELSSLKLILQIYNPTLIPWHINWSHIWQMEFNISKCIVINCTRAHTVISNTYVLQGQTLQSKLDHPYLGLTLSNTMQWSHHITNIASKD